MNTLLSLAEMLNTARIAANAVEATAPTSDAYGDISDALKKVLRHLVGTSSAVEEVYEALIDGCSVSEAIVNGFAIVESATRVGMRKVYRSNEVIGRIYEENGAYVPERSVSHVLPVAYSVDSAAKAIVLDYLTN